MQAELELGHDAEVAAAPFETPEEVRVFVRAGPDDPAVRGHDLGRDEALARGPELAVDPARAAPQRQAGDARVRHPPTGDRQSVLLRSGVQLSPCQPRAEAARARIDVDLDALHRAGVDDDPVVAARVPNRRVSAATHGDGEALLACMGQRGLHVLGSRAAGDKRRPLVDASVKQLPRVVIARVAGTNQLARERRLERLLDDRSSNHLSSSCCLALIRSDRGGQREVAAVDYREPTFSMSTTGGCSSGRPAANSPMRSAVFFISGGPWPKQIVLASSVASLRMLRRDPATSTVKISGISPS